MKIVVTPHPILTGKTKAVTSFDAKLKKTVKEMLDLLDKQNDPPGVGLAAPQVGLPIQLFIVKTIRKEKALVIINPEILEFKDAPEKKMKKDESVRLEGCLSIYGIWGPVKRHTKILLKYKDLEGLEHTEWFSGFKSTVIQHEIDHLNGVLFTQRVLEQKASLYEEKNGELYKIKDLV